MASHRWKHPEPVDGCFGCKALGVGVQTLRSRYGPDPVRRMPVVADDGPLRGRPTGYHTQHWDGRQDATIHAPAVAMTARTSET